MVHPPLRTPRAVDVKSAERIHFLDDQRRHRRSSRLSAVMVIAALVISGVPLSVLISPVVVAAALLVGHIASLFATLPSDLSDWLYRASHILPITWSALRQDDVTIPWRMLTLLFILPGTVTMVLLWALIRTVFRRTGVGGVLRRIGARRPRPDDLPEQRLVNLIEEIAIAGAITPPSVMLVDTPAPNAAAVGLTIEDATLVVTRGFLDRLPRDQQQAILAHVIGSIGNGDLAVAREILTVLQTWGLVVLALDATILPWARKNFAIVARTIMSVLSGSAAQSDREQALDFMLGGAGYEYDDLETDIPLPEIHPLALLVFYLPLLITVAPAAITAKGVVWLFTTLVAGPWVAFLWRARRRLADATAVELTRHPESLAAAVRTLSAVDVVVPGAVPVNFLFPVWDPDVDKDKTRTDIGSALLRMHLPVEARLNRLERLGAPRRAAPGSKAAVKWGEELRDLGKLVGWLAVSLLLLGTLMVFSAVAASALLWLLWWTLNLVFVVIPGWFIGLWS
jgi:Zn-dependent protease with chaperone function